MAGSVTYKSDYESSGTFKQVYIIEISIDQLKCTGKEPGGGPSYTIDLSTYSGNFTYPKIGDAWFITKMGSNWVLDRRSTFQNQVYAQMPDSEPGQTVIESLRVLGDLIVEGRSKPAGIIETWAGASESPPSGYLVCNGAEISRTVYSDLFAAIGTAYGTGNGTTTFVIPDFTGGKLQYHNTPGTSTGSTTHQHTVPGVAHTHTVPGVAHTHSVPGVAHSHALSDAGWSQMYMSNTGIAMKRITVPTYTKSLSGSFTAATDTGNTTTAAPLEGATDAATPGTATSAPTTPGTATSAPTTPGTATSALATSYPPVVGVVFIIST